MIYHLNIALYPHDFHVKIIKHLHVFFIPLSSSKTDLKPSKNTTTQVFFQTASAPNWMPRPGPAALLWHTLPAACEPILVVNPLISWWYHGILHGKKPDLDGDIMGFVPWWYHGIYILQYILQYILPYLGVAVEVVNDFFSGEITPGWDMCSFYDC
jgi:hypothetical protein